MTVALATIYVLVMLGALAIAGFFIFDLTCGLLFRLGSFWVGAHYAPQHKRVCINLLPCITFWIIAKGGDRP